MNYVIVIVIAFFPWAPCWIRRIAECACAGNVGNVFRAPRFSDPDMHHHTCVTRVPWCMPRSLTSGFLWSPWRGKRPRHSRRMRNTQFYVSDKRPMAGGIVNLYHFTQPVKMFTIMFTIILFDHQQLMTHEPIREPGPCLNITIVFPSMEIYIIKMRGRWDNVFFIMGICTLVRRHIYIETAPRL